MEGCLTARPGKSRINFCMGGRAGLGSSADMVTGPSSYWEGWRAPCSSPDNFYYFCTRFSLPGTQFLI